MPESILMFHVAFRPGEIPLEKEKVGKMIESRAVLVARMSC